MLFFFKYGFSVILDVSKVLLVTYFHMLLQVYSEISMIGRNPSKYKHEDVYRMPLLLATVYESARLLPIGPMLQRCSLKHGEILLTIL